MTATPTIAHPRTSVRVLVLGTALALGLSACGGDDKPSDDETPLGAIDKLYEELYGEWDEDTSNRQQMEVEELVAECMAGLGFEYIPVDYSQGATAIEIGGGDDELQWGTVEFAEQYGYGITTNPWEDQEGEDVPPGQEFVDPNQSILEGMTDTERQAYEEALWGAQIFEEMDPDEEWVEPSWEEQGCYGKAQHEIYGDMYGGGDDDPFSELNDEMNRLWEQIETHDKVVTAQATWASCMADAGHTGFTKVGDGEDSIYQLVEPIWNDAYSDVPPDATEEDYRAIEESIQQRLSEITPQEIETARADFTCREEAEYDKAYSAANLELQQQFYDAHKAELEEWLAYQKEQMDK